MLREIAVNRDTEFIALLVPREFHAGGLETPNTKENLDLEHDVCQALTGDKLHKTQTKDTTGFPRKPARVKRIGPRLSKVSDSTTPQVSFLWRVDGTRDRL